MHTVSDTQYRLHTVDADGHTDYIHSDDYSYLHERALRVAMRGGRAQIERRTAHGYTAF